jgi:hypothetical protein
MDSIAECGRSNGCNCNQASRSESCFHDCKLPSIIRARFLLASYRIGLVLVAGPLPIFGTLHQSALHRITALWSSSISLSTSTVSSRIWRRSSKRLAEEEASHLFMVNEKKSCVKTKSLLKERMLQATVSGRHRTHSCICFRLGGRCIAASVAYGTTSAAR